MLPVEIYPIQDAMVLRARGSELLILADHVAALKNLKSAGEFARYFMDEALVNRPARKLFEAWLRKDGSLWARIYKTVQTIESTPGTSKPEVKAADPKPAVKPAVVAKEKAEAKPAKKEEKEEKEEKKASAKKAEPKKAEEKKASAKPAKSDEKKASAKPAAKTAAKPAAKAADKPAAKTAAKKSSKK